MGTFLENKVCTYFKNETFQNLFFIKVGLLVQYFSKKNWKRFNQFSKLKNYFESQNFGMFKEVVYDLVSLTVTLFSEEMIHYFKNKVRVVDFANAQGMVMF